MRLMDANETYEVLTEYYHHKTNIQHQALAEALERVPTIEAEPVRHGWWERYDIEGVLLNCSECKAFSPHGIRTRYCPWCGARMEDK